MLDLFEIPEALVLVARQVEENRARLKRDMDSNPDFNPKHVAAAKALADASKNLAQEARQWLEVQRARASNRSVADNIQLALRFIGGLQRGDRELLYAALAKAEADRPDGLKLVELE